MNIEKSNRTLFHKVYPSIKENAKTLFFIHGYADCGDEFLHLVPELEKYYSVVLITLPGFGEAEALSDVSAKALLPRFVNTFKEFEGEKILVGYSMGGRYALFTTLHANVSGLTTLFLVSSSTGIDDENERNLRFQEDEKLAQLIEKNTQSGFAEYWVSLPIFKGLAQLSEAELKIIKERKARQEKSVLIQYLQQAGQGSFPSLSREIQSLRQKLHIVVGENDAKYFEIGKLLHQKLSSSELHIIPDSGHAVHRENPKLFLEVIKSVIESD